MEYLAQVDVRGDQADVSVPGEDAQRRPGYALRHEAALLHRRHEAIAFRGQEQSRGAELPQAVTDVVRLRI
jgi:hypothetical protein